MVNIIYPYRNRDLNHVLNSFESLKDQTCKDFEVYFVDYGSDLEISEKLIDICKKYPFINYKYYSVREQPWNKSRALNNVISKLDQGFCFVADVDMIFHPNFIKHSIELQEPNKCIYFQVGFLSSKDNAKGKKFKNFKNYKKSNNEATGLSMFPVHILQKLRGFDEFYHFWGAEDTDIHVRIKNAGYQLEFYTEEILMLHQWHPSYRSKESSELTSDLQISGIISINQEHLRFAKQNISIQVNPNHWGKIMLETQLEELYNHKLDIELTNEKFLIDDLLYGQLPSMKNRFFKVKITKSPMVNSLAFRTKKFLSKKALDFYTLKEVNDMLLLHIISFYRDYPYYYKIIDSGNAIEFAVKFK